MMNACMSCAELCSYRGRMHYRSNFDLCSCGMLSHWDLYEPLEGRTTVRQEGDKKEGCQVIQMKAGKCLRFYFALTFH